MNSQHDPTSADVNGDGLSKAEAIEYLGVSEQEFSKLLERYGVGRYHVPREDEQFVYARGDLDRIKADIK